MNHQEYLGDGVYAEDTGGMIKLSGNAYGQENVIYIDSSVYSALRRFAQKVGYEGSPET